LDRIEINTPSRCVNVMQFVRPQFDTFERGEELEQRIARLWNQNRFSLAGEQLEEKRIGFAGARRQMNAFGIDVESAFGVIARDRFARYRQATRRRLVKHSRRPGERA